MSSDDVVVDVAGLSKRYEIYRTPRDRFKQLILPPLHQAVNRAACAVGIAKPHPAPEYFSEYWALRDVNFQVRRGETLGIIGRNGSGKSTLLQILAGTLAATEGSVRTEGRIAALLELGSGFNPEFTGRENVILNGRILGLSSREIADRYERIVEFADIGDFIEQPVKTYSSGMFVRLAFAVQAHIDASIVIIDEALVVGDVFFRQKCYRRLEQLREDGAAILLVSHSMPDIEQYCERALVLDRGIPRFLGPADEAAKHYYILHQQDRMQPASRPDEVEVEDRSGETVAPGLMPQPAAMFVPSEKQQVGNGQARCTRLALTNARGEPCNTFGQGEVAVFYSEFEFSEDVGVPLGGVVISNDRGVIVHGKNAWQFDAEVPLGSTAGKTLVCRQEITLSLAQGEYTYEIGVAAVDHEMWKRRKSISHEEWAAMYRTICVVTKPGVFSVHLANRAGVAVLTHHGVADLTSTFDSWVAA